MSWNIDNPDDDVDEDVILQKGDNEVARFEPDGTLKNSSTVTDDIDIGDADFVATGDVIIVAYLQSFKRDFTTTSTSYTSNTDFFQQFFNFEDLPTGVDIVTSLNAQVQPGTDETVDVRVWNNAVSEVVTSQTGISANTNVSTGWDHYDPSSATYPHRLDIQMQTDPGNNSATMIAASLAIGYQL